MADNNENKGFYVTREREDGTEEILIQNIDNMERAYEEFHNIIAQQVKAFHEEKSIDRWGILRLYDENHKCIGQES